MLFFQ